MDVDADDEATTKTTKTRTKEKKNEEKKKHTSGHFTWFLITNDCTWTIRHIFRSTIRFLVDASWAVCGLVTNRFGCGTQPFSKVFIYLCFSVISMRNDSSWPSELSKLFKMVFHPVAIGAKANGSIRCEKLRKVLVGGFAKETVIGSGIFGPHERSCDSSSICHSPLIDTTVMKASSGNTEIPADHFESDRSRKIRNSTINQQWLWYSICARRRVSLNIFEGALLLMRLSWAKLSEPHRLSNESSPWTAAVAVQS